jgi:hypothetical protein
VLVVVSGRFMRTRTVRIPEDVCHQFRIDDLLRTMTFALSFPPYRPLNRSAEPATGVSCRHLKAVGGDVAEHLLQPVGSEAELMLASGSSGGAVGGLIEVVAVVAAHPHH